MSTIIDRRLNPKDKTINNRRKFIERSKAQIKDRVKDLINSGNIADIENGKAKIKVKGTSEPSFRIDPKTGNKKYVMPGNDKFVVGDTEKKPQGESASGGSGGGTDGEDDDFEFILNQDEYLDFIFEDLELPDLVKKQVKDVTKIQMKRAGYINVGNPSQLDIVRSLKNSLGRRISLNRPKNEDIEKIQEELKKAEEENNLVLVEELELKLAELRRRQTSVPWLDPFDIRYRNFVPTPQPITQAVMFCVLDVSGSMGEREKDLAKRFFFLLHMFLHRKYEKVDIVFIRHHTEATEVDEHDFFYSVESGGTIVSSALKLTKKIIDERYNQNDWNIYVAQSSDGDNFSNDEDETLNSMYNLLPLVQYFAYVEISPENTFSTGNRSTDLWSTYQELVNDYKNLNIKQVKVIVDIWKVFQDLFSKDHAHV